MDQNIGIITEQGDLGLGFDPLNESDQSIYNRGYNNGSKNEDKNKNKEDK